MFKFLDKEINYTDVIEQCMKKAKLNTDELLPLCGIFYTDGGSITDGSTFGGWGVHGYLYIDLPTTSSSGVKKGSPTNNGYVTGKLAEGDTKVNVLYFMDYYGSSATHTTNIRAELLAMIKCLTFIRDSDIKKAKIFVDLRYILEMLGGKDEYIANNYKNAKGKELANKAELIQLYDLHSQVSAKCELELDWVEGHSGNIGNEKADTNATRGLYIARNSLNNVNITLEHHLPYSDGTNTEYFVIKDAKEYWESDTTAARLLSESSLFFTTNGISNVDNNVYFQATFGKKMASKDKDERRSMRGKPFSDACISVVKLHKPDPVVNRLMDIITTHMPETGVYECDLQFQTRDVVYSDLYHGGLASVYVDKNTNRVRMKDGIELAAILNPVGQSFRMINDFNEVYSFLSAFERDNGQLGVQYFDITHLLYSIEDKKGVPNYKMIEYPDNYLKVPILLTFDYDIANCKNTEITLTLGIDLPTRVTLGRIKTDKPKITMFVWDIDVRTCRYGTIIETEEGIGIWMGIYSNIHLH